MTDEFWDSNCGLYIVQCLSRVLPRIFQLGDIVSLVSLAVILNTRVRIGPAAMYVVPSIMLLLCSSRLCTNNS